MNLRFLSKQLIAVVATICCYAGDIGAQSPETLWTRIYGGNGWDEGSSVYATSDGGFVISGFTAPYDNSLGDFYIIKSNALGELEWERNYGGYDWEWGYSVLQTYSDDYVILGYSQTYGQGIGCFYFIKLNEFGDTIWTRTYDRHFNDVGKCVAQAKMDDGEDFGYIMTGYTYTPGSDMDVYLVRTDYNGDTIWTATYGGMMGDWGMCVIPTDDLGFLVAGSTRNTIGGCPDAYIIKTDRWGDTVWTKTYGGYNFDGAAKIIKDNQSGGYVLCGSTNSYGAGGYDVYIVKAAYNGDIIWWNAFGGPEDDYGEDIFQLHDGSFLAVGVTESYGSHSFDVYLLCISANGQLMQSSTFGGREYDIGYSICRLADGKFIIVGTTESFEAEDRDVYVIKFDYDFTTIDNSITHTPNSVFIFPNYPNPFNASTTISYDLPRSSGVTLDIYDILGRKVQTLYNDDQPAGSHNLIWNADGFSSGVYFYKLTAGEYENTQKMMLLK